MAASPFRGQFPVQRLHQYSYNFRSVPAHSFEDRLLDEFELNASIHEQPRQLVLDPEYQTFNGVWRAPASIRRAALGFEFPDPAQIWPGDFILLSKVDPEPSSKKMIEWQKNLGYAEQHASCHHAAVSTGGLDICEAIDRGVVPGRIDQYIVRGYRLRVRRDPLLSQDQRDNIAKAALKRLGERYRFGCFSVQIQLVYWRLLRRAIPWPKFQACLLDRHNLICSKLCEDAYIEATSRRLHDPASDGVDIATPAFLSYTPRLVDVPLRWLKIL